MQGAQQHYPDCPEAMIVSIARTGDRAAFADLVRRQQSYIRNLMRRCCGDVTLADDLTQQVFMQVWLKLSTLKNAEAFRGWLKQLAISIWLQHVRKNDALRGASEVGEDEMGDGPVSETTSVAMDLDRALSTLSTPVRLCVVLSYQVGMSHGEIAELTNSPLGTVKSHITRGTQRLKDILSAYAAEPSKEQV